MNVPIHPANAKTKDLGSDEVCHCQSEPKTASPKIMYCI